MEGYMWLILACMFGVGLIFGFFFSRANEVDSSPKIKALEGESKALQAELDGAKADMDRYKSEVSEHFGKTAELFNRLTNDHRDVYEHLANGSEKLCGEQSVKLKSLSADAKVLEAEAVKETETKPVQAVSDKKETEEVSAETAQAAAVTEEAAKEARTVH